MKKRLLLLAVITSATLGLAGIANASVCGKTQTKDCTCPETGSKVMCCHMVNSYNLLVKQFNKLSLEDKRKNQHEMSIRITGLKDAMVENHCPH